MFFYTEDSDEIFAINMDNVEKVEYCKKYNSIRVNYTSGKTVEYACMDKSYKKMFKMINYIKEQSMNNLVMPDEPIVEKGKQFKYDEPFIDKEALKAKLVDMSMFDIPEKEGDEN
jgi:hypothetical protein